MTTLDDNKRIAIAYQAAADGSDGLDPVFVIAEGDLVVRCVFQPQPEPGDPSTLYTFFRYDAYRIVDGSVAEHWSGLNEIAEFTAPPREATLTEPPAPVGPARSPEQLAENKRRVADFYHFIFDAQNADAVADFVTEDYIQHAAHVDQGRAGLVAFVRAVFPDGPVPLTGERPTPVLAVAEGDIVVFADRFPQPRADRPGELYDYFAFDGFRLEDGMLAEHWSGIDKAAPPVHSA